MHKTLQLDLGERSYPIHIGPGLLNRPDLFIPYIRGKQVLVVTNETVAPLYLDKVLQALQGFTVASIILPDGEQYKTLEIEKRIFDSLLENRFNRNCCLVALGGGVVGDMAGFAAASYQRGVDFIQIPTTLLAQVDSSVGGKTGVNHPLGKNMIGAFHQPRCVLADTDTLNTLDDRQLSAGIAEVIKYGLIRDVDFYRWLESHITALRDRNTPSLIYAIETSCRCKADIVAADERESGQRALLNLGHTFGHAIETGAGYGQWLHGEAVAVGMLMAADLSARHHWISNHEVQQLQQLLKQAGLPTEPPADLDAQHFKALMAVDKKALDSGLRLILLKSIGNAQLVGDFKPNLLDQTLNQQLPLTGS